MKKLALSLLSTSLLLQGCATVALTAEGERVQVVSEPKAIQPCTYVGVVETDESLARDEMIYVLRNAAAALEADTLLIPKGAAVFAGMIREEPHIVVRKGDAYRCGTD